MNEPIEFDCEDCEKVFGGNMHRAVRERAERHEQETGHSMTENEVNPE